MEFVVEPQADAGWSVRAANRLLSRHSTQQQAIDAAKRRAAAERGCVVWRDLGGRDLGRIDYGQRPPNQRTSVLGVTELGSLDPEPATQS